MELLKSSSSPKGFILLNDQGQRVNLAADSSFKRFSAAIHKIKERNQYESKAKIFNRLKEILDKDIKKKNARHTVRKDWPISHKNS